MPSNIVTMRAVVPPQSSSIKKDLENLADELIASFPVPTMLSAFQRRGIIACYGVALEGNFIYWMTGAYLAAKSEIAKAIIQNNLLEEVRDSHPEMLRRFIVAADSVATGSEAFVVYPNLTKIRRFIGRLSPVPIIAMMAFFEDFIHKFMPYLAELAHRQGSEEYEYTHVHSMCDKKHSKEMFRALREEMGLAIGSCKREESLFEGVCLLRALIESIRSASENSALSRRPNLSQCQ